MDLDETVLDNSAYQAYLIASGSNYHEDASWTPWCHAGQAEAVPGAVEFVKFAREAGVTVLFITSRQNVSREGTLRNLRDLSVIGPEEFEREMKAKADPDLALSTILFMKGMSPITVPRPPGPAEYKLQDKFRQRRFCEEVRGFEIVLTIGDNLADWAEYYGAVLEASGEPTKVHPCANSRRQAAIQDARLFGRDFILLPNASYGGWLRSFEANSIGASDELAFSPNPVREPIDEPTCKFNYDNGKSAEALAPKFATNNLRIWKGPS
jgi:acid phosphatase